MKNKKIWDPILCLFLIVIDFFPFMQNLQPDGDKTTAWLYGIGLVALTIGFVISTISYLKSRKNDK